MDKHVRKRLIEDLVYLRKDAGFVPDRLDMASVFLEVVGGAAGETDFGTLKKRLVSALDTLDPQDAEVLKAAYGLRDEYWWPTLRARREAYGARIGRKHDTLVNRENAAINELALALLSARYTASPLPGNAPVYHNAALHERVEVLSVVRDRMWLETREHYRLIPLFDGAEFLEISSSIPAIITQVNNCVAKTTTTMNGLVHRFTYAEPLKRGKPVDLSFVMNPDPNNPKAFEHSLIEECRAFHEPTFSFKVEVLFLGEKPARVWQYEQLPYFTRPGMPTRAQMLDLSDSSVATVEFGELYGGLFSGLAWVWGEEAEG